MIFYHWALDLAAIAVVLAVVVPLQILRRRRPPRRPFIMPLFWEDAALWDTGVHLAPADPRRRGRIGRHRR